MDSPSAAISTVASAALGIVLLLSGGAKARDLGAFIRGAADYEILDDRIVRRLAPVVPAVEIALGWLLLSGLAPRSAATASLILLGIFALAVILNIRRGRSIPCHCFGERPSEVLGLGTLARLAILASFALLALGGVSGLTLWHWPPGDAVALTGIALVAAGLVVLLAPLDAALRGLWEVRRTRIRAARKVGVGASTGSAR